MDAFRAGNGSPRYAWNPLVHTHFGERRYFYLLSGEKSSGASLRSKMTLLMSQIGITPTAQYVVFGPFDLLVTAWMTKGRRQRLVRELQRPGSSIRLDSLLEFTSETVIYVDPEDLNVSNISESLDVFEPTEEEVSVILKMAQLQREGSDLQNRHLDFLERRNLVFQLSQPEGIKIYMFMWQTSELAEAKATTPRVLIDALLEFGAKAPVVYAGDGFCDYILEGVCADYPGAIRIVQGIQSLVAEASLEGWSLVPADYGSSSEAEGLDAASAIALDGDSWPAPHGMSPLSAAAREILSQAKAQQSYTKFIAWMTETLTVDAVRRTFDVLTSALEKDRKLFNRRLSFVISIESDARDILPMLADRFLEGSSPWPYSLPVTYPSWSYVSSLIDQAEARSVDARKMLETASMSDLLRLLADFSEYNADVRDCASRYLGGGWADHLSDVVRIRDAYAHGRILDQVLDEEFGEEWWSQMRSIGHAIILQAGLENLVEDLARGRV